jgi:2-dehydropantoate 2-reductase
LRLVIYGAGAVGGVIGARLHAAGHDVVLIARGPHLEAIRARGLRLVTAGGTSVHAVPAVAHPRELELREDDVVVLAMKTQHTAAALADLQASSALDLPIVCAQNGVENERLAARAFSRVYGMLVWLPANFLEPGEVVVASAPALGCLDAGRYPTGADALIAGVTAALDASGFSARPDPAIMRWKYHKLLSNIFNAIPALLGPGVDAAAFAARVRDEARACYAAAGIDAVSDAEQEARRKEARVSVVEIPGKQGIIGSSWQSLVRGTGNIETDYLNGEIALLGRLHGVPTPCNSALQIAARRIAARRSPPGSMSLRELEDLAAGTGGSPGFEPALEQRRG